MSNKVKRWKVLDWPDRPVCERTIEPCCPRCGWDGELEIGPTPGALILATVGLGIVFEPSDYEPPKNFMPREIQCRGCRRIFTDKLEMA